MCLYHFICYNIVHSQTHQPLRASTFNDDVPDHIEVNVLVAGRRSENEERGGQRGGMEEGETDASSNEEEDDDEERGPDRPPTMIDDDFDLNGHINETVHSKCMII